ncbi:hypothetical protein Golomagni_04597 [Golovinomyces magnicellulatus]|nr:hypothetical protein Golomagni_04597 [Golovinomyces magnicellulatus]
MFKSFSKPRKDGVKKMAKVKEVGARDRAKYSKIHKSLNQNISNGSHVDSTFFSQIVTIKVGREGRTFAAHADILSVSSFFAAILRESESTVTERRIDLLDEEPEILSCVLEYLYVGVLKKGDYHPRLIKNKLKGSWYLENTNENSVTRKIFIRGHGKILRDTVIYCAAEKYGLEELKNLALRKQALQRGIEVAMIIRSARYAYENTAISDPRLRSYFLSLIIRCRKIFKKSGTMQIEMETGGKFFFDLFVALCNHIDNKKVKRNDLYLHETNT